MLNSSSRESSPRPAASPIVHEPHQLLQQLQQTPPASPGEVTIENLHRASVDLLDVARRVLAIQRFAKSPTELSVAHDVLCAFAELAIEKAEGRR